MRVRQVLRERRWELAVAAAGVYPPGMSVRRTPLLTAPAWLPAAPVPLTSIRLRRVADAGFAGVTGIDAAGVLPRREDGTAYRRYSGAVAALGRPRLFEDRATYRLVGGDLADPAGQPWLAFGAGSYFDGVDVGEACAHEYAAGGRALRDAVGDPCDPARRKVNVAVSALTLRCDPAAGTASFPLHRRDAAAVGHAGGMVQVLPVGIFQPSGDGPGDAGNDFSLWRCLVREYAEELRGEPEVRGLGGAPVDYPGWPFAARFTAALAGGQVRAYCLGIGVDPLTFATDILTVVVIDAPIYDELFGEMPGCNEEGTILPEVPFDAEHIERYAYREPMQAAGSGLLALAWQHRRTLLG